MSFTCNSLIKTHHDKWELAVKHPFLVACKTGEITPVQFNTWLVQDYLFVTEFTRMVARVLSVAPVVHFDTVLGGLSALQDEMNWFCRKAEERDIDLEEEMQETNKQYCEFMNKVGSEPYPVQATAFWAIELAYNQAWQLPGPMNPPYNEFADRWGNSEFTSYVEMLEKQADNALEFADEKVQTSAEDVFLQVAHLEKLFWQMAYNTE